MTLDIVHDIGQGGDCYVGLPTDLEVASLRDETKLGSFSIAILAQDVLSHAQDEA